MFKMLECFYFCVLSYENTAKYQLVCDSIEMSKNIVYSIEKKI